MSVFPLHLKVLGGPEGHDEKKQLHELVPHSAADLILFIVSQVTQMPISSNPQEAGGRFLSEAPTPRSFMAMQR